VIVPVLRRVLNSAKSTPLVQNPDDRAALIEIGVYPSHIALIPGSGVDTDMLRPLPEPAGPITVGFAGRLLTDKGIRALVDAHRILRAKGRDIRLLIAGEPDPANPASVTHDEAKGWSKEPGITWLGRVEPIQSLWERVHIAALPSHREGLPKSLLEAAACGRPLIATDAPGCREIAIPDVTGFRVPIEDAEALATAICRLADDASLRSRLGDGARRIVEEQFSARLIGSRVTALYRDLAPL
jgi:glycosyltransferase involved in cell wall biosynthesis